jgi:hypothetical protein
MKEYGFRQHEGIAHPDSVLDEIARALGGEVAGRAIRAPSPGRGANDRSMVVIVDPTRPEAFYVYGCEGSLARAKALVREKLALVEPAAPLAPEVRTAKAMQIWSQTVPASGTIVEAYLRSRAIELPVPERIRFHPSLWHGPTRSEWPAMVALVSDANDAPIAVHRTYLAHNGRAKAPIEPNKMAVGPIGGGAIRLAPLADELLVGEGIETCLSAMQAIGQPAWSAISAVGLGTLALPSAVRDVTVLADGDDAGDNAARAAAARWRNDRRRVRIARAPRGFDFNDVLLGRAPGAQK